MIRRTRLLAGLGVASVLLVSIGAAHAASIALQFTGASGGVAGSDLSAGWKFTTTQSLTVVSLDDYAPVPTGNLVRIYDGLGTILASATVMPSDSVVGTLPSQFRSHALTTSVTLAAGTYYIAADLYGTTDPNGIQQAYIAGATGVTTISGVTYNNGVIVAGAGLKPTTDGYSLSPAAYFGPNFEVEASANPAVTAVPLPASVYSGLGLLGLMAAFKFRRKLVA